MLVKKISIVDALLPLRNIEEGWKIMFTGCSSVNSLIVLTLGLFLLLFQKICLALKSPPIIYYVVGSREISLCKVLGLIGFRGRMYTAATMSGKGVSCLTATYSSSRSG